MKHLSIQGKVMFYVVHYIPKERVEKRVIAAVANFESDDEAFVRDLFNTTYVGQDIVFVSCFSSAQLAQKHIADNGHYIESMETLFLPIADRGIGVKEQVLPLF
jgi:hypothetical protein